MTGTTSGIEEATAVEFFRRMNAQQVEYALLRNYEQYPSFGHDIDLVLRWNDLPKWKAVAKSCAEDFGWSALTECDHWAQSSCRDHTIQILRFYATSSLHYLQIDAFHAMLVNGLPLFDENTLLSGRTWDDRGFFRIDERAENFFRLLQIARLAGVARAEEKLELYRERALSFWSAAGDLDRYAASAGFSGMEAAVEHLRTGDFRSFRLKIIRQKRAWWRSRMFSHPWRGSTMNWNRFADYMRLFWLRPCGFTVRVSAPSGQRGMLDVIMKRLVGANLIRGYTADGSMKKRQQVMERGGIAVEWTQKEHADVILDGDVDEESVMARLVTLILERHPRILDRRQAAS
jgi:hypothetical protein